MNNHINYFLTSVKISYQALKEYKINIYSSIITQIFNIIPYFLFLGFIGYNFAEVTSWTMQDFILFALISMVYNAVILTINSYPLFYVLKSGGLNFALVRPINVFFSYICSFSAINSLFIFMNLPILFFILYFYNYNFFNLVLAIPLFIFLLIYGILFNLAIESFEFKKLGLSNTLKIIRYPNNIVSIYPAPFFSKFKYFNFLYYLEYFSMATLVIPVLIGNEVYFLKTQLIILNSLIIIYSLIIYFNWKYGLKKYEAYG